jgi:outer membrane usher protein
VTITRRLAPTTRLDHQVPWRFFHQAFALLCFCFTPLACWPAELALPVTSVAHADALVVRVTVNTEDKGDLFVSRTADNDFLVKVDDLRAIGFREPAGALIMIDGEPHLSLKSMRGIAFDFQERALALNITAEPSLLPSRSLQSPAMRGARVATPTANSAFFNYALDYGKNTASERSSIGFSGEAGWRLGNFLLLSDASTVQDADGRRRLVRLTSSVTHDDMANLRRTVVGDFFTPSRELSSGVNLGGVGLSKLYGLNPYLVQYPMQSVSGTVALPSDLEVYLDGQRIRSEKLKPGEFELRDILAYGGARSVKLVLRDPFGRIQEFDYSFYFTDQPLAEGLHEYSYNVGALRRAYGAASNRYGPPAVAMFHRYGVSDGITLGMRAEGMRGFYNAGPVATLVLGPAGVLSLALAGSSLEGRRGAAASAAYSYQSRFWSVGLALRRDGGEYATLGDPPVVSSRRHEGSAVATYHFPGFGSVSLSHSARSSRVPAAIQQVVSLNPGTERQTVTTLSYSAPLIAGKAALTASLSRIVDRESRNEATLRMIFFLDKDHSVAGTYQGNAARHSESVQFARNQPIGEGLGYLLVADRTSDAQVQSLQGKSTVQYNAPAAIVRGEYSRRRTGGDHSSEHRLSVAGGIAYVGGTVGIGRPVTGSFGIIKVGELADVAVSVNSQPMGKTNASGKLFVPTLNSYFDNDVSIAPETVPIDYSIQAMTKKVSPSARGGIVIDFGVTKVQAFSGRLMYEHEGARKPVEFQAISLMNGGTPQTLQTGRGGEFYFEQLKAGTYPATTRIDGKDCVFDITVPQSSDTFVELGEFMCRLAQ